MRRAFDLGVTHFDLANNYGPPYGSAEENFGRLLRDDLAPLPRRARDLDEGGLRHVARPVRRVGLAQVPAREPRPEPARAWGSTTSTSSTRTASTRRRRSRRRWARSTPPCGRARRSTPASRRTRRRRRARRRRSCASLGTPLLIHQPSYSMLNRWIEAELLDVLGERRRRLHRLLAARAGHADGQVPRRHPGGLARAPATSSLSPDLLTDETLAKLRGAERDRGAARPVARAAGARLDAARPARDLGADRRLERRAARGERRGARPARASPTRSWPRSTATRRTPSVNIWAESSST